MKKFFTLILFSLPGFIAYSQSITDSAAVKTDTASIATAPIPADSVKTAVLVVTADTVKAITSAVVADTATNVVTNPENITATPVKVSATAEPAKTAVSEPVVVNVEVKQKIKSLNKELFRRNIIKMNVTSLLFNNYNFTYERSLRRKMTFSAGYRFMPKTAFGQVPLFKKAIEIADEAGAFDDTEDFNIKDEMNNMFMSNTAYTGELRFYTGKKAGARGFYVSLYGRYTNMRFNYDYEYEGENQTYDMPISSTIKGYGGGLMLGAQWLIAKRVTFDWHILGAHYGKMSGTADGASDLSDMPQDERRDLEEEIESIGEIGDKRYLEATITDKGVNAKANGPFGGLRAGFTLGVAF